MEMMRKVINLFGNMKSSAFRLLSVWFNFLTHCNEWRVVTYRFVRYIC